MRYPDLDNSITLANGAKYSARNMLLEFCLGRGEWADDEATQASFYRIKHGLSVRPVAFEDKDFDRCVSLLKSINFPPHIAMELGELRIELTKAPKEVQKDDK